MLRIGTILHPTDYSEYSKNALQIACALARDYSARLVVLHVAIMPFADRYQTITPEAVLKEAQEQLNHLQLPIDTIRAERRVELGDPVSEILRIAKEISADVIVMGSHGRTGLQRLLTGSVTELVLRTAHCLVLTTTKQSVI